jgi:hypothetical protein
MMLSLGSVERGNEQIIRTTDITAKPRGYVGEHSLFPHGLLSL